LVGFGAGGTKRTVLIHGNFPPLTQRKADTMEKDNLTNKPVPYEQVQVIIKDRLVWYVVAGQPYSTEQFGTIFLKMEDWKKFRQSISTRNGLEKRCQYASERLWLSRRGYGRISKVYHHNGHHVCANDVLDATRQSKNWVYRRCEMWAAGKIDCDALFAPFKIAEDKEQRADWQGLTNKERPIPDDWQGAGTWEAENFDKISLGAEERCAF